MAFKNGIHLLDLHVMLAEYRCHKTNRYHEDYADPPENVFQRAKLWIITVLVHTNEEFLFFSASIIV